MTLERRIDLMQHSGIGGDQLRGEENPLALAFEAGAGGRVGGGMLTSLLRIAKKSPSVLSSKEVEDDRLKEAEAEDGHEETDRWSRSGGEGEWFKKDDASEGTLEGLQYGDDEEDGDGVLDLGFPMPPSTMSATNLKQSIFRMTTSTTTTSPSRPVQPLQQSPTSPTFSFTSKFRTPPRGRSRCDGFDPAARAKAEQRTKPYQPDDEELVEGYGDIYDNDQYIRFSAQMYLE
ncbi:hypothetical protein DFP72DRAFT_1175499 [Ephemerocybe angulata]|uniref:Uncharacterized protein n=1 Tax=Ephemerocybe angulata TaxID=980116 RepID=A0A8H6HJE6_9AGAR|nr:hypothetical protein DFP72DRAFT_1175499 [Tulosesus angulatus]